MKVLCSQEVVSPHLCEVVPCQVTAKASTPPVPGVVLCVWLQKGIRENMTWLEPIDFYAFSRGSFRKLARNLIEIAQRKSQELVSVNSFLDTFGPKIRPHQPRDTVAHISPGQAFCIHAAP